MDQPLTTIVVVPRERFGFAIKSLESLFDRTEPPFHLVYVDAGSPNYIYRRLVEGPNVEILRWSVAKNISHRIKRET